MVKIPAKKKESSVVERTIAPAVDFVKKIKPGSKVVIAHGHDNDTICSAVVMKRLVNEVVEAEAILFPTEDNFAVRDMDMSGILGMQPDYLIVVDIAHVGSEDVAKSMAAISTLFIDHHQPIKLPGVTYCNPRLYEKGIYMPVSYITYKIYEKLDDAAKIAWISGVGTLSDHGVSIAPDLFAFIRKIDAKLAGEKPMSDEDMFTYTLLGKIAKMFDSARIIEGKQGAVFAANALALTKSYKSIVNGGTEESAKLLMWYETVTKELRRLVADFNKKRKIIKGKIIFYEIPSKMNIKSTLSGHLMQFYGDKVLVVAQKRGEMLDVSFRRGVKVKTDLNKMAQKAIAGIPDAEGGGHEAASGARIPVKYLPKFVKQL